jgi:ATP-dependent DNA ligase
MLAGRRLLGGGLLLGLTLLAGQEFCDSLAELAVVHENILPFLRLTKLPCLGQTGSWMPARKITAHFIEPMLLERTEKLAEGASWTYELKLDGFRAEAIKSGGRVHLRSRNDKDFNTKYPSIVKALAAMPDETVIDGEIVALDGSGRPCFNALQNHSAGANLVYYVFDVMILADKDVMHEPLTTRRKLLQDQVLANLDEPIRESPEFDASLPELIFSVKAQGIEGLVAKRRVSHYEPGQRSGVWQKMRVNRGQAFVIAGYTTASRSFDALVFGYYDGGRLLYAGRTRSGFTPAARAQLFKRFEPLAAAECPFANLPEARVGRWGEGLTAEKMKERRWLTPVLVGTSSLWNGPRRVTFGIPSSSACAATRRRGRLFGSR